LNLAINFKASYAGPQQIWMFAYDGTIESGWVQRGAWTAGASSQPPSNVSVTPSSGSGANQTFAFSSSSPNGYGYIASMQMLFNYTLDAGTACYLFYNQASNLLYLGANQGTWGAGASVGMTGAGTLSNGQCQVNVAASSVSGSFDTLTLNLAISFQPSFLGPQNLYMLAYDNGGQYANWQQMGTWTSYSANPAQPTVTGTPTAGTGLSQVFTYTVNDLNGYGYIPSFSALFNAAFGGTSACYLVYSQADNLFELYNDGFTAALTAAPGPGAPSLHNSQCSLNVAQSSALGSGDNLVVSFAVTFESGFAGTKNNYVYTLDHADQSPGWQILGTWTVPAPASVLGITSAHSGSFAQGQTGAAYTLMVSNQSGAGPTIGAVTVGDTLTSGLTLTSMTGAGWTCSNTCTRSDGLAAGSSYPAITATVNVTANATSPQMNSVSVSGGGSATANGSDNTAILGFSVSVTPPASQSAIAGSATALNYPISIATSGGFNSSVTLALSGLPSGVTANWLYQGVAFGTTPQPLSLTVGSGTAPGSYTLTITGTATGLPTASTAQVALIVQPPPFTLSITQSPQSVQENQSATFTISALGSPGFTGQIALGWYNPPLTSFQCAAGQGVTLAYVSSLTPIYAGAQEAAILTPSNVAHLTQALPCNFAVSGTSGGVQYIAYGELDVTPVAGFTLTLNQPGGPPSVTPPSSGTVQANYPISVTSQNGYSGTVNFTAAFTGASVPQGVSFYAIAPVSISSGGSGSTTVTANVPPGVAAGRYLIAITGADSTGATHSVNAILNIQTGADYTLSVSPPQNIQQSQSASYQISMAPAGSGFSGTVTLSMGAITGGVTGSLSTTVIGAGSPATLTLNAVNTATLGTYPILVNGTATSGTISHSVLAVLGVALGTTPGASPTFANSYPFSPRQGRKHWPERNSILDERMNKTDRFLAEVDMRRGSVIAGIVAPNDRARAQAAIKAKPHGSSGNGPSPIPA
jgi:hypothetical protein